MLSAKTCYTISEYLLISVLDVPLKACDIEEITIRKTGPFKVDFS
jgi:hypothetical protein